jgi:hypothetical protein
MVQLQNQNVEKTTTTQSCNTNIQCNEGNDYDMEEEMDEKMFTLNEQNSAGGMLFIVFVCLIQYC